MEKYGQVPSDARFVPSEHWVKGNQVLVPLRSMRGAHVGCIGLSDPRDVTRVNAEELTKIEFLAADLAVTVDNTALHANSRVRKNLSHGPACCRCCP